MNGRCHKQGQVMKAFGGPPTPKLPTGETSPPPPPPPPHPGQFNEFDFYKTTVVY